jgi:uncharacterized membrane protein
MSGGAGMGPEEAHVNSRDDSDIPTEGLMDDVVSFFAGVVLLIAAGMAILQGLSAIANDDLYAGSDYLYRFDTSVWGWVHVVIAVLLAVVAIGVLVHASWGQVSGIIVAALSSLANFAFLPYYPLWSLIVIAINLLIIGALCRQLSEDR